MHIGIDISPTRSGHKTRGIGNYAKLLKEALQQTKSEHSFYFFARGEKLPRDIDLVHYTYFDPFFLTLPLLQSIPFVVTVHDLIPLVYPERFPRGIRGELKWLLQKRALLNADRIITDSKASKIDIQKIVGLSPEKIDVVYLAPSPIYKPISDKRFLFQVKQRYSLPEQFILYVGDVNWNKNIIGMLKALKELKSRNSNSENIKMVFVGKAFLDDSLSETQEINKTIQSLGVFGDILKPGFVPEEDLVALYNIANVYLQPSFAEGFGFPVLEAMACGCPVVTSRTSSLSEIAGPSILIDPHDPQDIARGICSTLRLRTKPELSKEAIAWTKNFTWKKTADETISVYEKAVGGY